MATNVVPIGEIRKKVTKIYELISASHHEAAHAIYALLHLMKVSSVAVFESKKLKRIHGLTYYDYPNELDTIKDADLLNAMVRAEIGVSYAGLIAEKILFRSISGCSQTPMFIIDGSASDNKAARAVIKKYDLAPPGPKRNAYKQKLMREVRGTLNEHWDAILAVSHALFSHRRLNFDDLQEVLTKKTKNKKFWKEQFKKINYFHDNKGLDDSEIRVMLSR